MSLEAVKVRLKLTEEEISFCKQNAGASRWVYNQALAAQIQYYNSQQHLVDKKFLSYNQLQNMLPGIKQDPNFNWLKSCESSNLQQSLQNLNQAFMNFFNSKNGSRKGRPVGFPKFKSKAKTKQSFTIINNGGNIVICKNLIKIPKLGWVRVWSGNKRLKLVHHIKRVTISKDSDGHWYAAILCEKEPRKVFPSANNTTGGLDLGLKTSVITNTGIEYNIPDKIIKLEKKIAKLQRALHRKVRDSKNREKARAKLSKCYFRIKKLRENFYHQLSALIATHVDILTIETLNIQGMLKNRKLARAISSQGWFQFITYLKYKLEKSGKILIQVGQFFPSSKLCSCCGDSNNNLTLAVRTWTCGSCNTTHDRDINAANNLNNISKWLRATGEVITTKNDYLASIIPSLSSI